MAGRFIIYTDTFLLRLSLWLFSKNVNRTGYAVDKTINYFDLGTHERANELNWVFKDILIKLPNPFNIYAFEANPSTYEIALTNTAEILSLKFFNLALVNKMPQTGYARLYKFGNGLGDSLYRPEYAEYVEVPARRFSELLKEEDIHLEDSINILRMNIEGCEMDVIQDLINNDLVKYFDGFYGMWDDLSKIDYAKDREFRKMLKKASIYPFPLNGRDMKFKIRKNVIQKSLEQTIFGKGKVASNS